MKITEFTLSYSKKQQVERFEPVEIGQSITVALDADDDHDEIRDELYAELRADVDNRMLNVLLEAKFQADEGDDEN